MSIKSLEDMLREASLQEVERNRVAKLTKNKVENWYTKASGGAILIYHIGCNDLANSVGSWQIKNLVWSWAVEGKAILLQRKIKIDLYEYLVQKPVYSELGKRLIPDNYRQR